MKHRAEPGFACSECGARARKWMGRCSECGGWNTLVPDDGPHAAPVAGTPPVALESIVAGQTPRLSSGFAGLDRVLGGGFVPGSVILLGGEPGIGKSTLLLQVAARVGRGDRPVLYASGEESGEQLRMRADRLGLSTSPVAVLAESSVERILGAAEAMPPSVLIVDSIQTAATDALPAAPGSVGQVRAAAARLVDWAKRRRVPTILIGHVTKDGSLAGPKTLEHMVDAVLDFDGERFHRHRVVRARKNRFGAVHELVLLEMDEAGLTEVPSPSALLLAERSIGSPGAAILAAVEGTRPILIEVQALVSESRLANPRRLGQGVDPNRLAILLAVLEKRSGLVLVDQDVYVNVAGGLAVDEPAADLAILAAVLSSFRNRAIAEGTVFFGEVGLLGEVRAVGSVEDRLREAASFGFRRAVIPAAGAERAASAADIAIEPVSRVDALLDKLE